MSEDKANYTDEGSIREAVERACRRLEWVVFDLQGVNVASIGSIREKTHIEIMKQLKLCAANIELASAATQRLRDL